MKQYEITVKILVTVPDYSDLKMWNTPDAIANDIANKYADMAKQYKSIGADKVLDIIVEPRV